MSIQVKMVFKMTNDSQWKKNKDGDANPEVAVTTQPNKIA